MEHISKGKIENFLKNWVNSKTSPKFAVLLEGQWGSGKTHFAKALLEDEDFTKRKKLYVSLFGVTSVREFERHLFFAAASKSQKYMHQGLGIAASIFSGSISVAGGPFSGSASAGKALQGLLDHLQSAADQVQGSFLVIDDLERCGFDQSELLGSINHFIEHGDARILLLSNTEKISDARFDNFREKVIGQTFKISADFPSAFEIFCNDIDNTKIRSAIQSQFETIEALHIASGYNNLRATRQFIWFFGQLLSALSPAHLDNSNLIKSLAKQAFIFFTEFKLNLGSNSGKLTPQDLIPEYVKDDKNNRAFYEFKFKKEDPDTPKTIILAKYKMIGGILSSITIRQWVDILTTGTFDADWLNGEIDEAPESFNTDKWPSWKRLWHLWDWDFRDEPADEFSDDTSDIISGIEDGRYKNPLEFMQVAGVILTLSNEKLIPTPDEGWVKRLQRYIDETIRPTLDLQSYRFSLWSFESGYEGLGFPRSDKEDFLEVRKYLNETGRSWYEAWKVGKSQDYMLDKLRNDFPTFVGNLTITRGGGDQRFLDIPILNSIDASKFVDAWLSLDRRSEASLTRNIKDRYKRGVTDLLVEVPWWKQVKSIILARAVDHPARMAQLRSLADAIEKLIEPDEPRAIR